MHILTSTVYHRTETASDDNPFQVDKETGNVLTAVNIHAYDNPVYYGNAAGQEGIIPADNVAWFDGIVRPSDFWFKNVNAGNNAKVVIVGIFLQRRG